jgi:hypothetical protein
MAKLEKLSYVIVRHLYYDHSYDIKSISKITGLTKEVIKDIVKEGDGYEQRFA